MEDNLQNMEDIIDIEESNLMNYDLLDVDDLEVDLELFDQVVDSDVKMIEENNLIKEIEDTFQHHHQAPKRRRVNNNNKYINHYNNNNNNNNNTNKYNYEYKERHTMKQDALKQEALLEHSTLQKRLQDVYNKREKIEVCF